MFKFKKFAGALAMTVALAQVFTAVPVRAEEFQYDSTCYHSECANYSENDDGYPCADCRTTEKVVYTSNNNGMSHSYEISCGCGHETSSDNSICYFEQGACMHCGQEQESTVCAHEHCNNETTGLSICNECMNSTSETKYVKVDDKVHDYVGICGNCKSENGYYDRGISHWNDKDGYCICGHDMFTGDETCDHPDCPNYSDASYDSCRKCSSGGDVLKTVSNENGINHKLHWKCRGCDFVDIFDNDCYFMDGTCVDCGQAQKYATCVHEKCDNATTDRAVCGSCSNIYGYGRYYASDANYHYLLKTFDCCDSQEKGELEPHDFTKYEGGCYYCGYGFGFSVSGNDTSSKPSAPTMSEEQAAEMRAQQQAAAFEAAQKKVVTTADGRVLKTEITGVYEVAALSGTAVTTPKADVQKAVGLTDEQIAAGTNASIFMGNLYDKAVKEALTNAAAANGKNVLSMFISDMYTITKNGQMTKINNASQPVTMVFGLPKHAVNENAAYSIICLTPDGTIVEMKDTDIDASTITIEATVFGKYAIVY